MVRLFLTGAERVNRVPVAKESGPGVIFLSMIGGRNHELKQNYVFSGHGV